MMFKDFIKRYVAFIALFAVMFSTLCIFGVPEVKAESADEIKQKLQELQNDLINTNKEIAKAKNKIAPLSRSTAAVTSREGIGGLLQKGLKQIAGK